MPKFRNEFSGGLLRDRKDSLAPKNTYYSALNAVHESESSSMGLVNEQSNAFSVKVPGNVVGTTHIEKWKKTLIFSDDGGSSLYLFDHVYETLEFVCSDSEFGCDWGFGDCEDLYGEVKTHGKCDDLVVYFSSDCIYYRVNLSEMLSPVRKNIVKECETCVYFTLFDAICTPIVNATPVYASTSTLESGAVSFAIQLSDGDGNDTNWFPVSNVVYLESENNVPGESAINAAELRLSGLDRRYEKINIAAIKTGSGVTSVSLIDTINYSGDEFTYLYYGQVGTPLNIATVTTQGKAFIRGKDLIQHDGRLYFYNLKNEKNINYQKYANNISVSGVEYEIGMSQQLKYKYPSMLRGETYDIGIVWNYADGTHSKAFHIPACGGAKSGDSKGSSFTDDLPEYNYDVEDSYVIKRNPSNLNDESDSVEEAQFTNVSNVVTDEQDLVDAAVCVDKQGQPHCCDDAGNVFYGCPEGSTRQDDGTGIFQCINIDGDVVVSGQCTAAQTAIDNDINNDGAVNNIFQNYFETLAEYGQDKHPDNVNLNTTTTLKEAAELLFDKGVINREYAERKRPTLTIGDGNLEGSPGGGVGTTKSASLLKGDAWSDVNGEHITEEIPKRLGYVTLESEVSALEYPGIKDCEGNRMYPTGNVCHHKFPSTQLSPHFRSGVNGTQNYEQAVNDPYGEVFVRLMGISVSNIHLPTEDELPKPLCPNTPYKIVYVKRDNSNKTILAKGWIAGVHRGLNNGKTYNFIRHGVNSFESVFRGAAPSPNDRTVDRLLATESVTFHSPDTDLGQSYIAATHIIDEQQIGGIGFRHGLYAKGKEPTDNWYGQRVDQRGARLSNNLSRFAGPGANVKRPIKGIVYSKNGTVTEPVGGIEFPLDNVYNESSVYLEAESSPIGSNIDESFRGDVLNHQAPTTCRSGYCALYKERESQYGAVENRSYIDIGVSARGFTDSIEGICGDIFITPYTKRRTSFVSEKVGDFFDVARKPDSECRQRSICDTPDDKIFEILGLNSNATELPESGDIYNPKNYAGTQTISGGSCGQSSLSNLELIGQRSKSDWYWPGTVTGVVHSVVESEIPAWSRQTGDPKQDQIHYPKLKNYYLDSSISNNHPWEESYLNHVNYVPVYQPSKAQLAKLALVRNIVMLIIPAGALVGISNIETLFEAVATMFVGSAATSMWMLSAHTLFTKESIRRMFGIEGCLRDEEGAGLKYKSERHWDNYNRYNPDFKKLTTENQYLGINSLYNTCACDSCDQDDIHQRGGNTNKEIYYSAKQNLDSEIDAYQNVKINGYNELPAHAGNIRKMFLQNNNLYVHSTAGIWTVQLAIGNLPADIGAQLTGDGELLIRPTLLLDGGMSEGFAGTNHPNASINVPAWGYFFVDDVARKIYRFNGRPEEISAYGMRKFFQRHLPFCEEEDCFDEKEGTSYALGWDHKYNRLLFTKNEVGSGSFTASYTPLGENKGKWISFHSYTPERYLWDRYGFFSVKGSEIWRHNVKDKFLSFYGQKYEHMIQFTMVSESLKTFSLKNVTLITEANKGDNKMLDVNFTRAAFWNNKYSTTLLKTNYLSDKSGDNDSQLRRAQENTSIINIKRNFDEFDITNIYHNLDQNCDENVYITTDVDCEIIETINGSKYCLTVNKQNNKNRFIEGRYVNVRLIYDDVDDIELNTLFIEFEDNTVPIKRQ